MESVTSYFIQQGVLGVIIVMLIGVVIWQQRRIDNKDIQITELQDKRVSDTNAFTNGYTEISKTMVASGKDTVNTLNVLQKSIDTMFNALQTLLQKKI